MRRSAYPCAIALTGLIAVGACSGPAERDATLDPGAGHSADVLGGPKAPDTDAGQMADGFSDATDGALEGQTDAQSYRADVNLLKDADAQEAFDATLKDLEVPDAGVDSDVASFDSRCDAGCGAADADTDGMDTAGAGDDAQADIANGDSTVVDVVADTKINDATPSDATGSGCSEGVWPGALGPGGFSPCLGVPTIAAEDEDALPPVPVSCTEPPVLAGTIADSYSFWDYFYDTDPWTFEIVDYGGIRATMAAQEGMVWFTGVGDVDGSFYDGDTSFVVVGVVQQGAGLVWAKQSVRTGIRPNGFIRSGSGAYVIGGSGDYASQNLAGELFGVADDDSDTLSDLGPISQLTNIYSGSINNQGELFVADHYLPDVECGDLRAAKLSAGASVLAFLEAGGPGYQSPFGGKVDKQSVIVPLGTCGYGLVTSGLAVEGDPEYKTVVLRLNEKLEVIGLWRWNISASYPDVETLDGDLILLSSTVEPNPWGDSNVVYHVVRVDGNTGVIKWRTDIDLPNHGASELAILPDNRIVLKGGIKGEWADPSINLYPLFSVLSPDGCVLAHVLYKDQLTSDGVPVMIATHLVALSNTLLADGDGPRVTFFNLPPTP